MAVLDLLAAQGTDPYDHFHGLGSFLRHIASSSDLRSWLSQGGDEAMQAKASKSPLLAPPLSKKWQSYLPTTQTCRRTQNTSSHPQGRHKFAIVNISDEYLPGLSVVLMISPPSARPGRNLKTSSSIRSVGYCSPPTKTSLSITKSSTRRATTSLFRNLLLSSTMGKLLLGSRKISQPPSSLL